MGFGVDLMVQARVVRLIVVYVVNIHNIIPFSRILRAQVVFLFDYWLQNITHIGITSFHGSYVSVSAIF